MSSKTLSLLPGGYGHEHATWLIGPVGHHRDSDLVEESNWKSMLAAYAAVDPDESDHEIHRFGHFAVGWVEEVAYRPDSKVAEVAETLLASLAGYPILDEDLHSEMESEMESENLHAILDEVRDAAKRAAPDLEDALDNLEDDALDDALRTARVDGESDGNGWRRYSSREIAKLVEVLRATPKEGN